MVASSSPFSILLPMSLYQRHEIVHSSGQRWGILQRPANSRANTVHRSPDSDAGCTSATVGTATASVSLASALDSLLRFRNVTTPGGDQHEQHGGRPESSRERTVPRRIAEVSSGDISWVSIRCVSFQAAVVWA